MQIKRMTKAHFEIVYNLLSEAFIPSELRLKEDMLTCFNNPNYRIWGLIHEDKLCGVLTGFSFENYLFGEYLAISPELRGKGLGKKFFMDIIEKENKPVIIEVERPTNQIATRRIHFYERLGFNLHTYDYYMPKIKGNRGNVPLYLMSYPNMHIEQPAYDKLKREIYQQVYQVK